MGAPGQNLMPHLTEDTLANYADVLCGGCGKAGPCPSKTGGLRKSQ